MLVPCDPLSCKVVAAVLCASGGKAYYSKHVLQEAIIMFYDNNALWPSGLDGTIPACQNWAIKHGEALARLVPLCN